MQIIDGKKIAAAIAEDVQARIAAYVAATGVRPILCDVLVGDDPVSLSYVNIKKRTAEKWGLEFLLERIPETAATDQVIAAIEVVQSNPHVCGLIVQLPLPDHIDKDQVLAAINPAIDVDCIGSQSSQQFYAGKATLVPPTAGAIMHIINSLNIPLTGKNIVVVGQGELVGKPTSFMLRAQGVVVWTADDSTTDLRALTQKADLLIAGTGQEKLITGDMVKSGAIVIDAGTSESGAGIVGDVDFDSVSKVAGYISPVPGGVGPVTVAKLLENVVLVAERQYNA